jgi:hypothetical protein
MKLEMDLNLKLMIINKVKKQVRVVVRTNNKRVVRAKVRKVRVRTSRIKMTKKKKSKVNHQVNH